MDLKQIKTEILRLNKIVFDNMRGPVDEVNGEMFVARTIPIVGMTAEEIANTSALYGTYFAFYELNQDEGTLRFGAKEKLNKD